MKKLLQVTDLRVTFKTLEAVRGVNFSMYEGEVLGIVGESGSGKSALAKALVKLHPSYYTQMSGQVLYQETDLMAMSERELQKVRGKEIGMIFQDPMTSLNPTATVQDQILEGYLRHFPHVNKAAAHAYAIEMLHLVGIPEPELRMKQYPHMLSGGLRQRVLIAIALASKPKLLIADEPTTALDVTIQAQILDLLKKIQRETQTSILLITHDLSVVASFCDRVLVMYAGRIIEEAPIEKLFRHPEHPYTQGLLRAIPRLDLAKDQPLIPIIGTPPDLSHPLTGCSFCPRCPVAMNICTQESPPDFENKSACWRHDPRRSP